MPTKSTKADQSYEIDGKRFTWHPLDDDDVRGGALADVVMPLRIKFGTVRPLLGKEMDATAAAEFIDAVAPGQESVIDQMDINDLMDCFQTWQTEYNALTGATLGE